jgi:phage protein D
MSATSSEKHVALYSVLVDGQEVDDELARRIREVRVLNYLRLPDVCTFTASFPRGQDGQPEPIDQQPFQIGSQLEIRLGARDALTTTSLFKGQIVTLEPTFGAGGVELLVRGFDRSHVLLRSRKVRTFQNQTSSDIVAKVVQEAGFSADCDSSGEPHDFVQQDNESDWDFIWRLADRVGFEFVVEDRIAHFRKPTLEGAIELEWPTVLHSFSPRVTAIQQVQKVTLLAQDPMTKQAIDVSVSSPDQIASIGVDRQTVAAAFSGATAHIATEPVTSQSEGQAVAQALLDLLANAYVAAEGVSDGDPRIKAGAKVTVKGVGDKFSGTYRVASATHVLRGGATYETRFANSPTHTLLGAVSNDRGAGGRGGFGAQLVLGVVTNNQDPKNLGRVRVKYPALSADAEGAWARVATPSAGKERGLLMLPVVGEEVLIAFEHDDTTRPYVLGSLFNGQDTPGDDLLKSENGSFAVKSDHEIYMESKEVYTIKTGAKLVVEAADNVEEKYQKDWSTEITGSATLKASQPFEIDGQNVTINGQAQVSIQGNSTLTISCGGSQIQLTSSGIQLSGPMITLG